MGAYLQIRFKYSSTWIWYSKFDNAHLTLSDQAWGLVKQILLSINPLSPEIYFEFVILQHILMIDIMSISSEITPQVNTTELT